MKPNGELFYQDETTQLYHVAWQTIGGVIDFTSTVQQPYIWGQAPKGHVSNGILYRRGIVTVSRQVLRLIAGGYEVVAEGVSQYEDDIQMTFPCRTGPKDQFTFHLNHPLVDGVEIVVADGPRWAEYDDTEAVWGDLDSGGGEVTVGGTPLEFIDVWG